MNQPSLQYQAKPSNKTAQGFSIASWKTVNDISQLTQFMFGSNLRKYLIKPFITRMVKPLDLMGAHECATFHHKNGQTSRFIWSTWNSNHSNRRKDLINQLAKFGQLTDSKEHSSGGGGGGRQAIYSI